MTVTSVGFAPVKGTRHTSYDAVTLASGGPVGDRGLCFVDVGRRRVLRTVQNPSLVALAARRDGDELVLELPDGRVVRDVPLPGGETITCEYWGRPAELELLDGPWADAVSAHLGFPVRLAAAPPGAVVYGAPVSLVTVASLRDLAGRAGRPELVDEAARFRATMVLDVGEEPHLEESWLGREVRVGGATLRVNVAIPRCAVIDLDPITGERTSGVLKALAGRGVDDHGDPLFGVDAHVVTPGVVRPGDAVEVAPDAVRPLPPVDLVTTA
jgi:uncharacterized protein YcbX